jgi:signal transduction histidine kinase
MPALSIPHHWLRYGAVVVLLAVAVFALPALSGPLLRTDGYAPHGVCILWEPDLLWTHVSTDILIGASYIAIGLTLAYIVYRGRRELPFTWVWLAFGAFIITCGSTHFMGAWTFWNPLYWLSGATKIVTAVASVATAIALPPLAPRVQALLEAARLSNERKLQLEAANAELRALNARLSELDELKQQLFANVSHELRTPLTLILGPTEQLLDRADPAQRRWLETIQRNALLLQRHVDDLLAIARLDAGRLELQRADLDFGLLVRRSAEQFAFAAEAQQVALEVEGPEELPAEGDEALLQRVLMNLIGNALKFTPPHGRVRIRLGATRAAISLQVDDSGPGVPAALRERIFERFRQGDGGTTRRHGGIGLGLAIAREVIELHGGTIRVDDSDLGGARFVVSLPRGLAAAPPDTPAVEPGAANAGETYLAEAPAPATAAVAADTAGRPVVLIVEDNGELRSFLTETLSGSYRLALAGDGVEGLARAEELRPDLILSDVMMPELSGEEFVAALRRRDGLRHIPVMMLTARADVELRVRLLRGGAQDYLLKPFSAAELQARLANLLDAARARATLQRALASRQQDLEGLSGEIARLYDEVQASLRLRDEFILVAAHELRTPVTALLGNAQLLARRWARGAVEPERDFRAVHALGDLSERLAALVETLIDFTRVELKELTLNLAPVDLGELVRRQAAQLAPALARHRLAVAAPAEPALVLGDARRLEQVVANLLANAVKYSPEGGEIGVTVQAAAGEALLTVRDEGVGIPAAALPHIFERFYRGPNVDATKISGFGIGLYLARAIVEAHGGTIGAASADGAGTTIAVRLPTGAAGETAPNA